MKIVRYSSRRLQNCLRGGGVRRCNTTGEREVDRDRPDERHACGMPEIGVELEDEARHIRTDIEREACDSKQHT